MNEIPNSVNFALKRIAGKRGSFVFVCLVERKHILLFKRLYSRLNVLWRFHAVVKALIYIYGLFNDGRGNQNPNMHKGHCQL